MSAHSVVEAPPAVEPARRSVVLKPRKGWQPLDLAELWRYRELLWILAARDIKVRYKQTVLGASWAILQPLLTMIVFTMIARFGNIPTDGIQPQVFYYCGMLPWLLFANGIGNAGNSLVGNQNLITKVYFPRLVIPFATVISGLIDFLVACLMLVILMAWYGVVPGPGIAAHVDARLLHRGTPDLPGSTATARRRARRCIEERGGVPHRAGERVVDHQAPHYVAEERRQPTLISGCESRRMPPPTSSTMPFHLLRSRKSRM